MSYWDTLKLKPTCDRKSVKKAYAQLLRKTRPEDDPEGYQKLREAFDWAMQYCKHHAHRNSQSTEEVSPPSAHENLDNPQSASESDPEISEPRETAENGHQPEVQPLTQEKSSDQLAHENAIAAMHQLYSKGSEALRDEFKLLISSDLLMNIKTRARFELILLDDLCRYRGTDLPYGLVRDAAQEFHWFREQHSHPTKQQQINYLEYRVSAWDTYNGTLVHNAHSANGAEKAVAKMLLGKFRPKYFNFLRFVGTRNRITRKYTHFFSQIVENGLCPELDTETFHWWQQSLQKCQFSFWHIIMGCFLFGLLVIPFIEHSTLALSEQAEWLKLAGLAFTPALVWGLDWLYHRYANIVLPWWYGVRGSYTTNVSLSAVYVISVVIWRELPDTSHIDWLIALALTASLLLYGIFGTVTILGGALVYTFVLAIMDPTDKYPDFGSLALIAGFITQKLTLVSLSKLPANIQRGVSENLYAVGALAVVITIAISYLYLKLNML